MKLLIQAPINQLSYGIVSTNILDNLGCNYKLKPLGPLDEEFNRFIPKVINYNNTLDLTKPSLKIFHEHCIFDHIGRGPRVAFPIFEKNQFNELESFNIRHQDLILVCSNWAKSIVEPINSNVHVCPLGVDEDFKPEYNPQEKVIFYTHGKRETRKGHDYLHKVFHKAFGNNKNVELWMFTHNPFDDQETTRKFQTEYKTLLGNQVKFFPRLPKKEMIKWLQKTDCGVFLTRAEGFGLPILECMAMGKELITTNYSGQTEFVKNGINPIEFEEAVDGKWFNGGFTWMKVEANEDEIIERMRSVYNMKTEKLEINKENVKIASEFTWQRTAREVLNGIQRL